MAKKTRKTLKTLHIATNPDEQVDQSARYELDHMDLKILRLLVEYPNLTKAELAEAAGLCRKALYLRIRKPAFLRALADLQKNGVELVKELQDMALRRMRKLIESKDDTIALQAAKFALLPIFNQAHIQINEVKEKVYRVQFGDGGEMFTDVETVDEAKKMTPLELLKEVENGNEQAQAELNREPR